jgi:hypothetical protein
MRALDSASAPKCSVYGICISQTSVSGNNRCHGNNAVFPAALRPGVDRACNEMSKGKCKVKFPVTGPV